MSCSKNVNLIITLPKNADRKPFGLQYIRYFLLFNVTWMDLHKNYSCILETAMKPTKYVQFPSFNINLNYIW